MRRIPVEATMDSDAWRPFDPVDVKRRVAATTGRFSSSRRRTATSTTMATPGWM
jgi:hypothetical protein